MQLHDSWLVFRKMNICCSNVTKFCFLPQFLCLEYRLIIELFVLNHWSVKLGNVGKKLHFIETIDFCEGHLCKSELRLYWWSPCNGNVIPLLRP